MNGQWLFLLSFRVAATLRQSLYRCSKAQTPYWASVTALTRGTGPPQALAGAGGSWLLPGS